MARMPVVADRPNTCISSSAQNSSCTERRPAQASRTLRTFANGNGEDEAGPGPQRHAEDREGDGVDDAPDLHRREIRVDQAAEQALEVGPGMEAGDRRDRPRRSAAAAPPTNQRVTAA